MSYPYKRNLKDGYQNKKNGLKVFSCFACGGGSTMGYKLAGYDVIGCNEIDKKMMDCYIENHHPKYSFLEDIRTFKLRNDLPKELYHLDILDGSPPCSSFSMAGNREADWGKEKKFKEGQKLQTLDDLFFDFIDLAKKLQPRVVIAENVEGLLIGEARDYVQRIYKDFEEAGYVLNHYLLNSKTMGVPQSRSRVFFIGVRKDLKNMIEQKDMFTQGPKINLEFYEKEIPYIDIENMEKDIEKGKHIPEGILPFREQIEPGRSCADVHPKGHYFQEIKLHPLKPLPTLRAGSNSYYHYKKPRRLFNDEIVKGQTFPQDYNFLKLQPIYVCGMSVPPVMMAGIAEQVYLQLFKGLKPE